MSSLLLSLLLLSLLLLSLLFQLLLQSLFFLLCFSFILFFLALSQSDTRTSSWKDRKDTFVIISLSKSKFKDKLTIQQVILQIKLSWSLISFALRSLSPSLELWFGNLPPWRATFFSVASAVCQNTPRHARGHYCLSSQTLGLLVCPKTTAPLPWTSLTLSISQGPPGMRHR